MALAIGGKIAGTSNWTCQSANAVVKRLNQYTFASEVRTGILDASDKRLAPTLQSSTALAIPGKTSSPSSNLGGQTLRHIENYLTPSDWSKIDNGATESNVRDGVFACRLLSVGCFRISEDGTVKWAMACSLATEHQLYGTWPSRSHRRQ